jgi:hypothetical protein
LLALVLSRPPGVPDRVIAPFPDPSAAQAWIDARPEEIPLGYMLAPLELPAPGVLGYEPMFPGIDGIERAVLERSPGDVVIPSDRPMNAQEASALERELRTLAAARRGRLVRGERGL